MPSLPVTLLKGDKVSSKVEYRETLAENMIPVFKEVAGAQGYMTTYPGLTSFGTGKGIDRGGVYNERFNKHFRVSGTKFIEVGTDGTVTELGDIPGTSQCTLIELASFNTQGIIADGKLFLYSPLGGLVEVTDADLGNPIDGTWIDGYYFLTDGEYIYHTDITSETAIDPLKFATAEFMPDRSLGIAKTQDNKIIVFGRYSIEYFANIASDNFAFRRVESRAQKIGIVSSLAKCEIDGAFFIIGGKREESISIHRVDLGSSAKIATREVDDILSIYTEDDLADVRVESRVEGDIAFILFQLPNHTLCYNLTIAKALGNSFAWSLIKSHVVDSVPYRGINGAFDPRISKWIYGDRNDSSIGFLDYTTAKHYNQKVEWVLYTPFLYIETASIDQLELKTIPGFNTSDDAKVAVSATYNGVTYSMEEWFTYSDPLDYNKRFILYGLGYVPQFIGFKFRGVSESRMTFATMGVIFS